MDLMTTDIGAMLEEEIKRTIEEISDANLTAEQVKTKLVKLNFLCKNRMDEVNAILKETHDCDETLVKREELEAKKAELDLRREELEVKQAQNGAEIVRLQQEAKLRERELDQKDAELKEVKRTRRWRTVLDILGITVPTAATGWWILKGMEFEEKGQVYSSRTANFVSAVTRLFNKKG